MGVFIASSLKLGFVLQFVRILPILYALSRTRADGGDMSSLIDITFSHTLAVTLFVLAPAVFSKSRISGSFNCMRILQFHIVDLSIDDVPLKNEPSPGNLLQNRHLLRTVDPRMSFPLEKKVPVTIAREPRH